MPAARLVLPHGRRRRTRLWRVFRAAYRDTVALWNEFRWPILAFLLLLFGGGWLYGELMALAGYPRVPYQHLLYYILEMMVLQPPPVEDVPTELYLILFWYIVPVLAILIVGRGAAEFVNLFFNRSERRNAWEEAVASTYRNHIIILGVGHVGLRVARALVSMGFDVVAIDQELKPDAEDELAALGVPIIKTDGRNPQSLDLAGLRYAQAFVACTSSDQTNLEVIMRARDLNPEIRIVARMWDDTYAKQMKNFMGVDAVHSASDLAAPVFAGAAVGVEITQTLQIAGVEYSMIRLQVEPGSFLDGGTIGSLQEANDMDIVLHGSSSAVEVQPSSNIAVRGGDTLVLFARHDRVINIVERNQKTKNR